MQKQSNGAARTVSFTSARPHSSFSSSSSPSSSSSTSSSSSSTSSSIVSTSRAVAPLPSPSSSPPPAPPPPSRAHTYTIRGIPIQFPYSAYTCQQLLMEKVIEACQSSTHALLESPTGTGKTAALLCSVLAWVGKEVQRMQTQLAMMDGGGSALSTMRQHQLMMNEIRGKEPATQLLPPTPSTPQPYPPPTVSSFPPSLQPRSTLPSASSPFSLTSSPHFIRPRIIYSSRTHSQLSKVISELRRTVHRPKSTLLGSRQQLCVHPDVRSLSGLAQNHACHSLVNGHQCVYYENLIVQQGGRGGVGLSGMMGGCMDLEDLLQWGVDHKLCPYFATREVLSEAELVLMPYNYLIDPTIRDKLQLNLQGSVIIFDEAHNLESVCVDASSFDLTSLDITAAINETQRCIDEVVQQHQHNGTDSDDPWSAKHTMGGGGPDLESLAVLKTLLLEMERSLDGYELRDEEKGDTRNGEYVFEWLNGCHIGYDKKDVLLGLMDDAVEFLFKCEEGVLGGVRRRTSSALAKIAGMMRLVYGGSEERSREVARDYRVHIHQKHGKKRAWAGKQTKGKGGGIFQPAASQSVDEADGPSSSYRVFSYWCFNPGVSMATLSACGVRSFLFTSGTLSPLDSFASEFQLPFPVRLENSHIIQPHQISLSVIERGPSGHPLLSSYLNRSNPHYIMDLGAAVVNICRVVPDGVLLFFPSYGVLEQCRDEWERGGVMGRVRAMKHVVVEPRQSSDFNAAIAEYQAAILKRVGGMTGAIFFAVCRGKVSEGLDFADANGRAVIITGLPFPALHEPRVRIKREFLDQQRSIASQQSTPIPPLTGSAWYQQQASRAVNQAIGRVIRHVNDYGAIVLCDERFGTGQQQSQLSGWVRGRVVVYKQFGGVVQPLRGFFKRLEGEGMGGGVREEGSGEVKDRGIPMGESGKRKDGAQVNEEEDRTKKQRSTSLLHHSFDELKRGMIEGEVEEITPTPRPSSAQSFKAAGVRSTRQLLSVSTLLSVTGQASYGLKPAIAGKAT